MLLARSKAAHLYGFARSRRDGRGRPSYGLTLKLDGGRFGRPLWRQVSVGLYGAASPKGRGCWTVEAVTWRARAQTRGDRVGTKVFIRLKVGLGGDE